MVPHIALYFNDGKVFLFSEHGLACQEEILLVLAKLYPSIT